MIVERRAATRGHTTAGGVDSRHAFSSGGYYDPQWMGFGALRVLNEATLAPGAALPPQRHANMELLHYVLSGVLAYAGAAGSGEVRAGELLWIGAGHGIELRTCNGSGRAPVRFLQAWIQPDRLNAMPALAHGAFDPVQRRGRWATLASPDGAEGSLALRQRAWLRAASLDAGGHIEFVPDPARRYWLHVARGAVRVGPFALEAGDALGLAEASGVQAITGSGDALAEVLLFDLPA